VDAKSAVVGDITLEACVIKTILVPLSAVGMDDPAFAAALWVAQLFGGHIDFLYARVEPADAATQAAEFLGGAIASADMIERLEAAAAKREEEALKSYRSFCEREQLLENAGAPDAGQISAAWHRESGRAADWVTTYGRTSDLLVVGRPASHFLVTAQILEAALLDTGRPVVIPGSTPPDLGTVAIAWKPAREAARAVSLAMPFLTRAKRIMVLAAADHNPVDRNSCDRLVEALRRQSLVVETSYIEPGSHDVGKALLAAASKAAAGLLVMGAFSHRRLRELFLGGITEHMLKGAEIPLLLAH
jgi:nucleotide-binding universal stress UspA family protein